MHIRRRESFGPFLVLVTLGVAIFLLVKFILSFFGTDADQSASFRVAGLSGEVKHQFWGEEKFETTIEGDIFRHGDIVRTYQGRVELNFADLIKLRLDNMSEVDFSNIGFPYSGLEFDTRMILKQGTAWVNSDFAQNKSLMFSAGDFVFGLPEEGIFQFSNSEALFQFDVFEGELLLEYYSGANKIMQFSIPAGAGATFSQSDLTGIVLGQKSYESFLRPLSESIFENPFAVWNRNLDSGQQISLGSAQSAQAGLIVLYPQNGAQLSVNEVEIRGLASPNSHEIVVYMILGEEEDAYRLRKFRPGDKEWRYVAALKYANLVRGENFYRIEAVDELGEVIESAELRFVNE